MAQPFDFLDRPQPRSRFRRYNLLRNHSRPALSESGVAGGGLPHSVLGDGCILLSLTCWVRRSKIRQVMNTHDAKDANPKDETPAQKKPYIKPEFRLEKVFVTSALSCGKTGTEGQCHMRSMVS